MTSPADISRLAIAQIRSLLLTESEPEDSFLDMLAKDKRQGVRRLAVRERRRRRAAASERARLEHMRRFERRLRAQGVRHIAGVDEVGRGPLAGPVVASSVILGPDTILPGLKDSKCLTPEQRDSLSKQIRDVAVEVTVGSATPEEIDRLNILQASLLAMRRALKKHAVRPDRVIVDGNRLPGGPFPEIALVDGDASSCSVAAASIIAKTTRDRQMKAYHEAYPEYGFDRHKGYGSSNHLEALRRFGPCPIHRRSFRTVASLLQGRSDDFAVYEKGIEQAADLNALEAIGRSIAGARDHLPPLEIKALRSLFARRRDRLNRTGAKGERIAADDLTRRGYRIVERSYRAAGAEIDIVARREGVLAFIEVKTATSPLFGPPETWVTPEKQRQIEKACRAYLQRHPFKLTPRLDVMVVRIFESGTDVRHLEGAFRIASADA